MTKVDITVAGHTIIIEADESLDVVSYLALDLYRQTSDTTKRLTVGFAPGAAQVERGDWCDEMEIHCG